MSIFKFSYQKNISHKRDVRASVYFLNESKQIVPEHEAKRFVVKRKTKDGFKEFFGAIENPNFINHSNETNPLLLDEASENLYNLYHLGEDKILQINGKKIPLFIPSKFLQYAPLKFGDVTRTIDEIAEDAEKRREFIYNYYKTLDERHVQTLTEVKCTSVAELYTYLNGGRKWKIGNEFYGYVDGLWETGSFLTVSIDTPEWDLHTSVHELGHSVSYYLIDELFNEWYSIATDKKEEPPTDYGHTEVSEDFAESYSFFFGLKEGNEMLKKTCPKRYAYMEKVQEMGSDGLVKILNATTSLTQRFQLYNKVVYGNHEYVSHIEK